MLISATKVYNPAVVRAVDVYLKVTKPLSGVEPEVNLIFKVGTVDMVLESILYKYTLKYMRLRYGLICIFALTSFFG